MSDARDAHATGGARATELMCQAAALLAGADSAAAGDDIERTTMRAAACRFAGQYLAQDGEYARAASMYQQAVDQYLRLNTEIAEANARSCAGEVMACIRTLRARPEDRLDLLVAQYEDREREYGLQSGHERECADCRLHIAHILHRRGRFDRSIESYELALDLYTLCGDSQHARLGAAECHFRIGTLIAAWRKNTAEGAKRIRLAELLYEEYEPNVNGRKRARDVCRRALMDLGG
jgi:tetratricopeptide (TPR) repeat protein